MLSDCVGTSEQDRAVFVRRCAATVCVVQAVLVQGGRVWASAYLIIIASPEQKPSLNCSTFVCLCAFVYVPSGNRAHLGKWSFKKKSLCVENE